jgi:hypothetical protein
VLRFQVSVEDLLRSRFALSPAMDLCFLLRSLAGQDRPLPRAWATRLLPAFERLRRETELNAALALHTTQSGPNFVAPPPRGLNQTWADDLGAWVSNEQAARLPVAGGSVAAALSGPVGTPVGSARWVFGRQGSRRGRGGPAGQSAWAAIPAVPA